MNTITASAPGSIMLFGEHAVLHGRLAVVAAIDQRIQVALAPRRDRRVRLISALGEREMALDAIDASAPFTFAGEVLRGVAGNMPSGVDLEITAEFSATKGLGSSAAVTVAVAAALNAFLEIEATPTALHAACLEATRRVQGRGSGADLAASVFGGCLAYRAAPFEAVPLAAALPITLIYSGSKMPTPEVIDHVEQRHAGTGDTLEVIFDAIDHVSRAAAKAIDAGDGEKLGVLADAGHGLMEAMGVGTVDLSRIVFALRADPAISGAKISGSGLGDCALGFGSITTWQGPGEQIPVAMASEGVRVDS